MATFYAGCHEKLKALANKLAPGRRVKSITIDIPSNGAVTAKVEVLIETDDLPLIEEITPDAVTIIEVPAMKPNTTVGDPYERG